MIFLAFSLFVPITTRSGFIKSSTANPSLKNSGLDITSNSHIAFSATAARTFSAVPTGTVLLLIMILYSVIIFPNCFATPSTYDKSAEPSSPGGVGNARKIIVASFIASSRLVVKTNLFCLMLRSNKTSK